MSDEEIQDLRRRLRPDDPGTSLMLSRGLLRRGLDVEDAWPALRFDAKHGLALLRGRAAPVAEEVLVTLADVDPDKLAAKLPAWNPYASPGAAVLARFRDGGAEVAWLLAERDAQGVHLELHPGKTWHSEKWEARPGLWRRGHVLGRAGYAYPLLGGDWVCRELLPLVGPGLVEYEHEMGPPEVMGTPDRSIEARLIGPPGGVSVAIGGRDDYDWSEVHAPEAIIEDARRRWRVALDRLARRRARDGGLAPPSGWAARARECVLVPGAEEPGAALQIVETRLWRGLSTRNSTLIVNPGSIPFAVHLRGALGAEGGQLEIDPVGPLPSDASVSKLTATSGQWQGVEASGIVRSLLRQDVPASPEFEGEIREGRAARFRVGEYVIQEGRFARAGTWELRIQREDGEGFAALVESGLARSLEVVFFGPLSEVAVPRRTLEEWLVLDGWRVTSST